MERGEAGRLLMAALEWRGFLHDGLQVRPEDIPADEYFALRVLKDEEPASTNGEYPPTGPHGR